MNITWDLETTPLQIKTDSTLGSGDRIWVYVNDAVNVNVRRMMVTFSDNTYQYGIYMCNNEDFPVQPKAGVDKIWTIAKTETALTITCNGVQVLNFVFADAPNNKPAACVQWWGGDIVEQIRFSGGADTASDFYLSQGILQRSINPEYYFELKFVLVDDF